VSFLTPVSLFFPVFVHRRPQKGKQRAEGKKEQLSNGVQNESKCRDRGQAKSGAEVCRGKNLEEKLTLPLLYCIFVQL